MTWIDEIKPEYGTVTGQFVMVSHDSADEDLTPDVQPLNGTVLLTPTVNAGRIDDTVFAQIATVEARIFGGQIVDDEDTPGIRILSTDTNIVDADWAWRATFQIDSGIHLRPLDFKVDAGKTVHLTGQTLPIDHTPHQIIQGEQGASITGVDQVAPDVMRVVIEDPATGEQKSTAILLPEGPRGPEGPYGGTEVTDPQVATYITTETATRAALESAYRRSVSPREYGAVGDGITDDTAAMQAAVDSGMPVHVPAGQWVVSGVITDKPLQLDLAEGAILRHLKTGACITVQGSEATVPTPLTVDATPGVRTITAPGHGLAAGDWVRLASDAWFDELVTKIKHGELAQVESVDGDAVTLCTPVASGPYRVSDSARLARLSMVDGVRITGPGSIVGQYEPALQQIGIVARLCRDVTIDGITSRGIDQRHIFLPDCSDFTVQRCVIDWAVHTSQAYGVSVCNAAQDGRVIHNVFRNVRHTFSTNNEPAFPGVPRRIQAGWNTVRWSSTALGGSQGGGDAIDTHAAAEDIWFDYNIVEGSAGQGINFEARSGRIVGNRVRSTTSNGIVFHNESSLAGTVKVTDNIVEDAGANGIDVRPGTRNGIHDLRGVDVSRNIVRRAASYGMVIGSIATGTGTVDGLTLTHNRIEDNGGGTALYVRGASGVVQMGNTASGGGTVISVVELPSASPGDAPGFSIQSISSGTVAVGPSTTYLRLAATSTDTLHTITGGARGQVLTIRLGSASAAATIASTGNIKLASPFTMASIYDTLTLACINPGGTWVEVSRVDFA